MLQRLALFTGSYNHIVDGVSLTLNRLVRYLEANGVEVMVLGPTTSHPPMKAAGTFVPVRSLPFPGRPDYRITLPPSADIRRKLRAFDPQIAHVATPDFLGLYAMRFSRARDIPLVASFHTNFSTYLKHYRLAALEGVLDRYLLWFYHSCEHVYVPTPPIWQSLVTNGLPERKLRTWGRGIDMDVFNPEWRSEEWRARFDITADDVLVSFIGRLVREKGLDVYADVVERLTQQGRPFKSMIVGDGPLREPMEERLPGTIFTGHLSGADLSRAYASSDVFLYPSDSEAFGNVIVEAMASGVSVVAAGGVGSSSHVRPGETGLLAPPGDIEEFVRQTDRLIQDHQLRQCLGRRAHRTAREEYDWPATLAKMLVYYEELV